MAQSYDSPHIVVNGEHASDPCVLLVGGDGQLLEDVPRVHGPFKDITEAQEYARTFREHAGIPGHENVEPTGEENEAWTDAGWYFGIVKLELLGHLT